MAIIAITQAVSCHHRFTSPVSETSCRVIGTLPGGSIVVIGVAAFYVRPDARQEPSSAST
jgi:hypothetical protein